MKDQIKNKTFPTDGLELPEDLVPVMQKVKRLEIITVAYLISVVIVMYLTLSSSQAMKAAWMEDILSMVPAVIFLIGAKYYNKRPTHIFPYGFHRVFSIGFAFGSFALLLMGIFISVDSVMALLKQEHPTIPHKQFFGQSIWFGWVMILALLYSFIPAVILGRMKKPLAKKLHNKLLNVDAEAQKADWMTAGAAIIGILGIGFGWWWADAVAALFISFSILKDGFKRFSESIKDFLGQIPTTVEKSDIHPVNGEIVRFMEEQDWVKDYRLRLREEGEVFLGEIYVVPLTKVDLIENIEDCVNELKSRDWKIHEITMQPVKGFHKS